MQTKHFSIRYERLLFHASHHPNPTTAIIG
jgi:hypothetical protein